jgi:hypothetical protein
MSSGLCGKDGFEGVGLCTFCPLCGQFENLKMWQFENGVVACYLSGFPPFSNFQIAIFSN